MASLIGINTRTGGIKGIPSRVGLYTNGVGLGPGEQHPDTITIVRDTRVFPDGEAPPDWRDYDGSDWPAFGQYWYAIHDAYWQLNPADFYQITNEQGGGEGTDVAGNYEQLVKVERAIMQAANADGRKCCVLNLAGGSPGDFELWKAICAPFIFEAWETGGNIYGRHLYSDKFVNDDGSIVPGQPQRVIDELEYLRSIGYDGGMVLTECGLFGGYGVADYDYFEQQVTRWEQALRPYADIFIGLCWWETGASEFNADYTAHIKKLSPYIEAASLPRWTPPEQPEEPPMEHKAICVKLPQDMTAAEWLQAADTVYPLLHTMTASHDDMLTILNGGNAESFVKFSHPERDLAAVDLVESAGYRWERLYDNDTPPPPLLQITDIVNELPKHATLKYATRPLEAITTLTIHHTVSPPDRSIESIAAYHVDSNGWPGIGYHYVIKDDGRIFQTNYLTTKSYHAGTTAAPGDENLISVGISLQGDFTNAPPPQTQQDAARELVANLRDNLPGVTAVLGHRQMPGAATACPGATWATWLPYVAGGEIAQPDPPPPPPPPAPTIDLLQWFRGDHRRQFDKEYKLSNGVTGTQTTQVFHLNNGNDWLYIKGENGHYEHLGLRTWNGQEWIFRFEDTSEASDRWYSHFMSDGGAIGAPWLPRFAEIGKWYETPKFVQHYGKDANGNPICTKLNSDNVVDKLRIVSEPYGRAYESGQVLQVITAEWSSGEQYDFAGGNVAFRNAAGDNFWFMQWLEGRADKTYKKVECLNVGW